jgi:hypothetical protein
MSLVRVYDNERKVEYTIGSRAAEASDHLKVLDNEPAERDGRALPASEPKTSAKKAASGS